MSGLELPKIKCVQCGSDFTESFMPNLNYYRCNNCEGIFVFPILNQSDYLNNQDYLSDPDEYLKIVDPRGSMWLIGKFEEEYKNKLNKPVGNLLEVGSGLGHLLILAFARGWDVEGIETSRNASEWAKKNLKMDIKNTTIEDFSTNKKYDAIVMIEVIEHFLNANFVLDKLKELVNIPALIFGTTPNTKSKSWSKESHIYEPNDHIFLFTNKSIELLFSKLNIHSLSIQYFGGPTGDAHIMFSGVIGERIIIKPDLLDLSPAGEIICDTIIRQKIIFPFSINKSDIILRILFATYSRANNSKLKVIIEQEENRYQADLETNDFVDNQFKDIYFKNVSFKSGLATVIIIGIDGAKSNAVTVWLTKDTPFGGALINDRPQDKGMVLEINKI